MVFNFKRKCILGLCLIFSAGSAYADSMRCGSKLIKTGDSTIDVLLKCGDPNYKEDLSKHQKKHTRVNVERHLYKREKGQLQKILVFHDGVLVEIQNGPRN
ncbi:DUF2845 domain-containing protein [Aliiglaciecola lipolytica]|uniref:DUF2845 domain-containing protein n=1 Tax=Aliiglaciecola lipolytica E3 TaxID=1127673 RepID=K6Y6Q0_9ALTE|nr:DUF2845 domain-containing protein [Aliiglaciecola lipolytica]GAC13892.1 hypothetical protein GLIP_1251 [Aliiglaciecola lipolytica E3]